MDIGTITIVLVLGLIFLLAIGMPLGFASLSLGVLILFMAREPGILLNPFALGEGPLTRMAGKGPLVQPIQNIFDLTDNFVLLSVPLFIFMASLLERSGIAKAMYDSLDFWLNQVRGGVAIVTSLMAVIMAAMSGIIGGEVVLLGLIALPQMLRLGYNQNLAIGTICASGSLGTMIPPSIVLIMYGLITETSIKALFTAAFLPGFLLASLIILYIIVRTQLQPSLAPLSPRQPGDATGRQKFGYFGAFLCLIVTGFAALLVVRAGLFTVTGQNVISADNPDPITLGQAYHIPYFLGAMVASMVLALFVFGKERTRLGWLHGKGLVAPITVIGVVLGSIYGGITGITEAAGMGAFAVLVIAIFRGEANFGLVWESIMRTVRSTGTIIWVTLGAAVLSGAYIVSGGPQYIAELITSAGMPPMMIILTMMLILLFMGAFMDWVGIVLLIIPVFLPIVSALPVEEIGLLGHLPNDPKMVAVWFGVVFCMNMQVSFLSPPFGPAAFYLKSVAPPEISLTDIFKGFLPFIGVQLLALSVLLIWPSIVTLLL